MVGANVSQSNTNRLPGACTYCKHLKNGADVPLPLRTPIPNPDHPFILGPSIPCVNQMKCYFPPGENVCKHCRSGKHDCIVEGRKPRNAPKWDELIDSLVKQNVIAWLNWLRSSVRSPARSAPAANPFHLDTRAVKVAGQSDESDEEPASQKRAQQRAPSSGSEDVPVSPNTLVESDIDPSPDDAVPIGLLETLRSVHRGIPRVLHWRRRVRKMARRTTTKWCENILGVANKAYFMPGPSMDLGLRKPLIDKTSPPDILVHRLVTPEDVEKLFEIFYTRINPFISLLEPKLHTPTLTFSRCPFLFTVVCAISLHYSEKHEVHSIAMHFAKTAAANALIVQKQPRTTVSDRRPAPRTQRAPNWLATIGGWESVELCQAYILLSIYAVPARRWEEGHSWLYTGLAIRIATDLNLHILPPKKPTTEQQELEMLNRTRIWIICFNIDKSTATQFGKPSTLKEDFIVRKSLEWYKSSPNNHPYDVHIIAYTSLFRIVNKFHQDVFSDPTVPNSLNCSIDFRAVTLEHDRLLTNCRQEWAERFERDSDHSGEKVLEMKGMKEREVSKGIKTGRGSRGHHERLETQTRRVCRGVGCARGQWRGLGDVIEVLMSHARWLVVCGRWTAWNEREVAKDRRRRHVVSRFHTYTNYARLVMFSFGFQNAFQRGLEADDEVFFARSLESAKTVVTVLVDSLVPTGYIRFSPDGYFVFAAFASACMLKLYSRFLASLLAKHKCDGTAQGRMPQQGPPSQQMQTGSSTPRYQQPPQPSQPQPPQQQQQRQQQQPAPPQNTTSSSLLSGVSSNAGTPDLHQSMPQNSGATAPPNFTNTVLMEGPGNYVLEQPPDFMFGVAGQPDDLMDFTFDTITTPGNDDLLATMQAIQNPTWWQNMMMPGFFWPAEEVIQDHMNMIGNGMNTYQNLQQPAEGLHA
ncbi:hypothetical protein F5148DRAFT_1370891 [Russula earlei]|uniref:Uncharacterized protein n=2 Tax=Russula earlei TaxID=71964 RepID=A0ACC0TUU8_9AGAM|nr:hypothetical protein F5148DRAFT_1370891 [Russula earlei]